MASKKRSSSSKSSKSKGKIKAKPKSRSNSSSSSKISKLSPKTIRLNGELHDIHQIKDHKGKTHKVIKPSSIEFQLRDALQVIIGASVLSVPVGFTEEVWRLGQTLPTNKILLLLIVSISFISLFVYYNSYKNKLKEHLNSFILRVSATYILSLVVVSILLFIIGKISGDISLITSIKRIILVAFPASMSAAVSDSLK